jgi:prevent-host-death family protein
MTVVLNVAEAKAKLSELIARAEAGEEVLIARAGKPVVALTPAPKPKVVRRQPDVWAKYGPPPPYDAFLKPDPELEALMDAPIFPDQGVHE